MKVDVLGPLVLQADDGARVSMRGGRRGVLLGLLAASGTTAVPVATLREQLGFKFGAEDLVHVLVARTRAQLAQVTSRPVIDTIDGAYRLNAEGNDSDVWDFHRLLDIAAGESSVATKFGMVAEALDLWRSTPFLASSVGGEWPPLRALMDRYWSALAGWADLAMGLGHAADVSDRLLRAVDVNPVNDAVWAALLAALHRQGRTAEAESAYRRCVSLYGSELGVEPGDLVQQAHPGHRRASTETHHPAQVVASEAATALRSALVDAADYAITSGGYEHAVRAYRAVLEHGSTSDTERPHVLLRLGEALYHNHEDALGVLVESKQCFLASGDKAGAGAAQLLAAKATWLSGTARCETELAMAAELLDDAAPGARRTRGLASTATMMSVCGDPQRALRFAQLALRTARRLDKSQTPAPLVDQAMSSLGFIKAGMGDFTGMNDTKAAIQSFHQRDGWVSPVYLVAYADQLCQSGDLDGADRIYKTAETSARNHGAAADQRWIQAEQTTLAFLRGRDEIAARMATELLTAAAGRPHYTDSMLHLTKAGLQLRQGATAPALRHAELALTLARPTGDEQALPGPLSVAAHANALTGDLNTANTLVDELLDNLAHALVPAEAAPHLAPVLHLLHRQNDLHEVPIKPSYWLTHTHQTLTALNEPNGRTTPAQQPTSTSP